MNEGERLYKSNGSRIGSDLNRVVSHICKWGDFNMKERMEDILEWVFNVSMIMAILFCVYIIITVLRV